MYPYACLNIDCSWTEWLTGVKKSIYSSESKSELEGKISSLFSVKNNVIVTVCIRTAFDLFLQALNLPIGSEVVITSINIPEMTRIIRKHGLIPVPVDICTETLVTPPERVEKVITKRTKLLVIARLYGVSYDMSEVGKIAKKYNLPLFEDCSECYSGNNFTGNECADATSFSFGPIKTATAFGGGVLIVRNEGLLSKIRSIHSNYPIQSSKLYRQKVFKYVIGKIILNTKLANQIIRRSCLDLGIDYKKLTVKLMRGFPPTTGLDIYRNQPCVGLLSFLY